MCKQDEVKVHNNIRDGVGTIKEAELAVEGMNEIIVDTSVYDSKPVYFLSSSCT